MNHEERIFSCANCAVTNCSKQTGTYPAFCPTTHLEEDACEKALARYEEGENKRIMQTAAAVEGEGYGEWTRVQETIAFAKRMGYHKLGIATCVGLIAETRMLEDILHKHGFQVYGIACKVGSVPKSAVGITEDYPHVGKVMCNPILQAELLNAEGTELNIVMGLCVGHDALFYQHAKAPTTTLVVKDRVTGHNPAAALYTAKSYYKKLYDTQD